MSRAIISFAATSMKSAPIMNRDPNADQQLLIIQVQTGTTHMLYSASATIHAKRAQFERLMLENHLSAQDVTFLVEDDNHRNRTPIVGNSVEISGRISRYFEAARTAASNSVYGKLRHGAVLVKGGSILSVAYNKDDYTSFASRFRPRDCGPATRHAETECILGASKERSSRADMFVCRINRSGEFRLSKPCLMCHIIIKNAGIKRVFYTTNYGGIEMYKL
jgi:deoxycytidylate deaminase